MPTIHLGTRKATIEDRTYRAGQSVPVTMHAKHYAGKYAPHYGKKESAKLAARLQSTAI